ncbi:MAG TPA: 2-amino-4-hydroxy-6-hydroxymethyldihydropteridine diphosphokinase, partial [Flavobacteriaceae bacterium]|nr:2-amino-4-hydroxy-6-hydroxymethyldihydropteridine diphosphokinase [Flavobacteriaceae bacterium]
MTQSKTVLIALGSNKGNKFENLQAAVDAVYRQIGNVLAISKVYKTKALGFESDDFFNACMSVNTQLAPKKVLKLLLDIEKQLGRERSSKTGYHARTIDLDVLAYDNEHVESNILTVPHPRLHERQFVLQPLQDIAPHWVHPVLDKNLQELVQYCPDTSVPEPQNIWLKNPSKQYSWKAHNFIAIEGNIGAGKTSLATQIAEDFNAKLILERFADNPFLPKFYKEPQRYAFT